MNDFPVSVQSAAERARWWTRYALDHLGSDGRAYHPGVKPHLTAALAQADASVRLAQPGNDRA